ncbi:MAG: 5-formyltetrahydrofolate cyclo-ligase [Proteobacteria bacterium]|nr:5-formyltetrahydrofolate cyclo-ligase [Pseudomonadota bacterium]
MSNHARDIANSRINEQVIRSHEFSAARTIACYLPMNDEVDPTRIIRRAWCAKKRVFCPVIENNGGMVFRKLDRDTTLQRNRFGLWEPVSGVCVSSKSLDLVITPLVAFDTNNHRIGMGGGFFDRSFAFLKHKKRWLRPKLIGLAFPPGNITRWLGKMTAPSGLGGGMSKANWGWGTQHNALRRCG